DHPRAGEALPPQHARGRSLHPPVPAHARPQGAGGDDREGRARGEEREEAGWRLLESDALTTAAANPRARAAGVPQQISLPLSKAVEIAWKSIRLRLSRSLLVTSGIVLALAFLMSI